MQSRAKWSGKLGRNNQIFNFVLILLIGKGYISGNTYIMTTVIYHDKSVGEYFMFV